MSARDGFLSRWSRRKLDPGRPARDEAPPVPPAPDASASRRGADPAGPEVVAELSPEELASLPPLEELTAESDLAPFLRAGVPALLRNGALRRMWSLDPAIRDFVGEARDYSYDWNVAGGVPVSGPLLPGDDARETLDRMFSRLRSDPVPEERPPGDGPPPPPGGDESEPAAAPGSDPAPTGDRPLAALASADAAGPFEDRLSSGPPDAAELPVAPSPAVATERRRHGAAIPKFD